ncbi:MAG: hypothetical protein Ct9H300mP11_10880 [Chloroflexota bacterium]|nr:MAG: hypothetical protein Ct9H300mP11_10880 [Chloroflexota bacterium]
MENLPVEIYTWTILAVIDSAETPFLEATFFPKPGGFQNGRLD